MKGYLGKLLSVDLTTGHMHDEPLNMAYARRFIGNSGLAARYLYNMVDSVESVIPVDIYVAGCPPRPDEIINGVVACLDLMQNDAAHGGKEWRQGSPSAARKVSVKENTVIP